MREDTQQTRFPNGLTILTDRMPGVRSVTLGFFYRTGSRHETKELNGITHFIEHAVFKGTARRSALEIAVEQDRLGGSLDAFTTHEETGFAVKVIDDQLETAFDLLADMLANPAFDEKELKSEQRVIIEEMKMMEDSPEEYLGEIFSEAFFPDHPLGLSIAGTPKTVRGFSREKTQKYHKSAFGLGNLVIVAAGNVEHSDLLKLVEKYLNFDQSEISDLKSEIRNPVPAAPIVIRQNKNLEQAHLILATPFTAATDERRYPADLLTNIIGGGMSSRLWQKIREDRGLAYSVGASNAMYQDCGIFSVFAGTSPEQTGEVVDIAVSELGEIVRNGVNDEELELAKQQARAAILLSLEDSAARAAALAQSEMVYGRHISVNETLNKIDAVSAEDVIETARAFFLTESVAFAALGDLNGFRIDRDRLAI